MNKNLKVVSSLALAGILATTGLTGLSRVSAAEVTDPDTRSLGKYASLGGVENVVPYILNGEDKITVKDLKKEFDITAFNGTSVASEDTVVGTGDTFKSGNTTYTVIVYGDTNGDGLADSDDAFDMLSHYVGNKTLSGIYLEAANVEDTKKNAVDSDDAFRTKSFFVGNVEKSRDEAPANLQPVEGGYTLVINENNIINNQNANKVSLVVKLDTTLSKKKENLIVRILDQNGDKVGTSITANDIDVHMDQVELAKDKDLTTLANGTYTVELVENEGSKEKVLARTTVEKNIITPAAVKVSTERTAWNTATLSLENSEENGVSNITKVYYVVTTENTTENTTPTFSLNATDNTWKFNTSNPSTTYTASTSNSSLKDEQLQEKLNDQTAYKVYYVLENSYGSRSAVLSADIKSGKETNIPEAVDASTIKVPDLKKGEKEFTWTAPKGATKYNVVVYKDGKVVSETKGTTADAKYDITKKINGAGKYKIEIATVAGTNDKKDSEYVMSSEVEVTPLNKVTDIEFNINENGNILSWKDSNDESDVSGYTVGLTPYDEKNKEYNISKKITVSASDITKNTDGTLQTSLVFGTGTDKLSKNTAYKAEIFVVPNTAKVTDGVDIRRDIVSSEVETLNDFFVIDLTGCKVGDITANSAKITISNNLLNATIKGSKLSNYRAQAYKAQVPGTAGYNPLLPQYVLDETVTSEFKDGKILVGNLQPESKYVFKIFATVNGKEGESEYLNNSNKAYTTLKVSPEIKNRIVTKTSTNATKDSNYVFVDLNKLVIDGKEISLTSKDYAADFLNSVKVIANLNEKDVITLDGDTVTVELGDASNGSTINFAATVKDKVVNINGRGYDCTITTSANAKELNLSGNNSKYHLTSSKADKITLSNDVVVDGNSRVNVLPGTVTINGVKVTTSVETEINTTAATKKLEVTVNGRVQNDLVFENLTDNNVSVKNAEISFKGDGTHYNQQLGTIIIKTNNGTVKVRSTDVNVDSTLNVEVEKGSVDIVDTALTGSKNITVSHVDTEADSKITFKVANKVSFKLTNTPVQKYETGASVTGVAKINSADPDIDMEKVIEFLNSFKLTEDAKATLTTTDGETFTLTISGDVTNYTIPEGIVK